MCSHGGHAVLVWPAPHLRILLEVLDGVLDLDQPVEGSEAARELGGRGRKKKKKGPREEEEGAARRRRRGR